MVTKTDMAEDDQQRLARLSGYLGSDPGNSRLMAEVIDLRLAVGDRAGARRAVDDALARFPGEPGFVFRGANVAIVERRLDDAESSLRELLRTMPAEAGVVHNLAYVLVLQARYAEAAQLLASWVTNATAGPESAALLVHALHHAGRVSDAAAQARALRGRWNDDAHLLAVGSLALWDAGEAVEAAQWSARALQSDPKVLAALVTSGSLALQRGDTHGARGFFQRALEANDRDGRSWSGLGIACLLEEQLDEARPHLMRAIENMPDHIGTWHALAWCDLGLGRREEARRSFEKALQLDRNFAESHGALAVVAALDGRREEAAESASKAFGLDRSSLTAAYAKALLAGDARDPASLMTLATRLFAGRGDAESLLRRMASRKP